MAKTCKLYLVRCVDCRSRIADTNYVWADKWAAEHSEKNNHTVILRHPK